MRWLVAELLVSCTPAPPAAPRTFSVRAGFIRGREGSAVIAPYFDFHQAPDVARLRDVWVTVSLRRLLE